MAAFSQIVQISHQEDGKQICVPNEYVLLGDEAKISQDSAGRLIVEPLYQATGTLQELLNTWEPLGEEDALPAIPKLPAEPFEL